MKVEFILCKVCLNSQVNNSQYTHRVVQPLILEHFHHPPRVIWIAHSPQLPLKLYLHPTSPGLTCWGEQNWSLGREAFVCFPWRPTVGQTPSAPKRVGISSSSAGARNGELMVVQAGACCPGGASKPSKHRECIKAFLVFSSPVKHRKCSCTLMMLGKVCPGTSEPTHGFSSGWVKWRAGGSRQDHMTWPGWALSSQLAGLLWGWTPKESSAASCFPPGSLCAWVKGYELTLNQLPDLTFREAHQHPPEGNERPNVISPEQTFCASNNQTNLFAEPQLHHPEAVHRRPMEHRP